MEQRTVSKVPPGTPNGPAPDESMSGLHTGDSSGRRTAHTIFSWFLQQVNRKSRRWPTLVLRICVASGLVFLLMRQADWAQLQQIIAQHGLRLYLWLVPIAGLGWFFYTWRWKFLLLPLGLNPSVCEMVVDSLIGLFYGLFIPTGLAGDVVRATRLGSRYHSIPKAFLSIAIDRTIGLFSVILLFGIQLIRSNPILRGMQLSWTGWIIFATLMIVIALIVGGEDLLGRQMARWPYREKLRRLFTEHWPFNSLGRQIGQLWRLVQTYSKFKGLVALSVATSVLYQLIVTLVYYTGGTILKIRVSFEDYVWIVALVSLAQVLPITLAGLGVREGLFAFLLKQYGVPATTSIALSLTVFSVTLLFGILGGGLELINIYRNSKLESNHQITQR